MNTASRRAILERFFESSQKALEPLFVLVTPINRTSEKIISPKNTGLLAASEIAPVEQICEEI